MSDDRKLDDFIDHEAKAYRAASKPPADVMWSRIERDVARAIHRPAPGITRHWAWLAAGAGIAAALVVGINIGRRSMMNESVQPYSVGSTAPVAAPGGDQERDAQMRAVMMGHFVQAEVFLTEVRTDLTTGRHDPRRGDRSRQLLSRTRLLMTNNARRAPTVERLLQDLELVLAEIAALPDSGKQRTVDARLLDERLRAGTILPRIRTLLPAPSATGGN